MSNRTFFFKTIRPLKPLPTHIEPAGRLSGRIKCLLFDIYGTLFISGSGDIGTSMKEIGNSRLLKKLMLKFKISQPLDIVLNGFYTAISKRHALLKTSGIDYPEVKIDYIWMKVLGLRDPAVARDFALEFELIVNPIYPMPGLKRLLEKGRDNHCCMGLISNAQFYTPLFFEWFFDTTLEDLGFQKDLLIFSYQSEYAKPSEYLFRLAKRRLDSCAIVPAATLYVGNDMLNDILPAKNIGFKTALFAGDRRSLRLREDDDRCRGVMPDIVITELSQLIRYL